MITVSIERKQRKITSFTITGHAESGPYGHDLVCAAVSAVSFGTVNAIEALCNIEPDVELRNNGGYLKVIAPSEVEENTNKSIQLLLEGMVVSLQTIERDYHEYIQMIEV
ncbi:ribosomal-processing cysteine protease Prp [Alkalihalobacillus sp. AL-G]|uniref:ribosomal-processing cysteine protease Prp n=1 Tax=Alkalihalobacillus sp. AL-G TaxID=2926399 RepID=UPI00272B90CD|nr:ribosomal-processing cysteine protease Prp [Alkalihalobacillus sp. AL-G]WLD92232.1 ribosomal-processing cysteine protease Prp [Alkalihalobacillus sp. AL-G]